MLLVAARLGAALTRSRLTGLAHLAWDGATGLAVLIAAWLAAGLLPGGFRPLTICAVGGAAALAAAVLAARDPISRWRRGAGASIAGRCTAVALAALAVAGLAWDRVPPLFFDTLAYQWALPEMWLIEGRIAPVAWSLHSWFPPGMSVLYGVGLALGGPRLASDANLLMGLLLGALAWDFGRRCAGAVAGAAAALVLVTLPITLHALAIPGADLGHGCFAAASLAALLVPDSEDERSWRRRAAWLAGGAALTKYLGFLVPIALGAVWVAIQSARRVGPARSIGRAAAFALPALVLMAPWLIANTAVTGNPVAPVGATLIATHGLADGGVESFRRDARGGLPTLDDLRRLPARLFSGDEAESRLYPTPAWGSLPLLLVLGLPLVPRRERPTSLLVAALATFAIWLLTYRSERFLVATSFLLAVATGIVLARVWQRGGLVRLLPALASLVALTAVIDSAVRIVTFTGGASVLAGRETPQAFVERSFPAARLFAEARRRLDARDSRILFVGEMRHYGLGLPRVAPHGFNAHPLAEALGRAAGDATAAASELRARGFTHLLVDPGWVERSAQRYPSLAPLAAEPATLAALSHLAGPPIASMGGMALIELPSER